MRERAVRLLVPSLPCAVWLALFLTCTVTPFASALISADGDLAQHVRYGQLILSGWDLEGDPLCFLPSERPYVLIDEWLGQVIFAGAHALFGLAGPVLVTGALVASLFAGLLIWLRRLGVGPLTATLLVLGAILVARLHLLARPHLFTWALALMFTVSLERLRLGEVTLQRWLLFAAPLTVLWVNLHGGFVLAFYLLGLFGLGQLAHWLHASRRRTEARLRLWSWVGAGVLLLLASGLNPHGFGAHLSIVELLAEPAVSSFRREFAPLDLGLLETWVFLGFTGIALLALALGRAPRTTWILTLGLLALTTRSARHAPLLALLATPGVGLALQRILDSSRLDALRALSARLAADETRRGGAATALAVAVAVTISIGVFERPRVAFDPRRLPVDAAAWCRQHPDPVGTRLYATFHWGGFLAYELPPETRLFMHAFYLDRAGLEAFQQIRGVGEGWDDLLAAHEVSAVVEQSGSPLSAALARHPRWREVYADDLARIFVIR